MNPKDQRIEELEKENARLKNKLRDLSDKLSRCYRSLNREKDSSFDSVYFDDDR